MSFLTAEWRDLAILNWEIPPELLAASVPSGTQLDTWNGRAFVSLVGFRFVKTRIMKLAVPWHVNFDEVNLRFYVKRCIDRDVRRGVVFIKEIVPRACIAFVARRLYNENYVTASMTHSVERRNRQVLVKYDWMLQGTVNSISVRSADVFRALAPDSQAEFIIEHYWGYCRQRDGGTVEYHVSHPRWQVAAVDQFSVTCDAVALYGKELGEHLLSPPVSALLANGSPVEVGFGRRF
jgi:uncharacterized protein